MHPSVSNALFRNQPTRVTVPLFRHPLVPMTVVLGFAPSPVSRFHHGRGRAGSGKPSLSLRVKPLPFSLVA